MKMAAPFRHLMVGRLAVVVHRDAAALGHAAAREVAGYLQEVLAARGSARVVFGCCGAPEEFLAELAASGLDWTRVTVFHADEYAGLRPDDPRSTRRHLREHLLVRLAVVRFHGIEAERREPAVACDRYAALLGEQPLDLACLDLGENGRLAGNDPAVADFDDPAVLKCVELDDARRRQPRTDARSAPPDALPRHALTLTLPVFRRTRRLCVLAPGAPRAPAVRAALRDAITTACPATMLRLHPQAMLHLDSASAALAFGAQPL